VTPHDSLREQSRHVPQRAGFVLALVGLLAAGAAGAVDCSITTTGVAFGTYDPTLPTPNDATGDLTVVCTYTSGGGSRVDYAIALSTGFSGSYVQRLLRSGPATLSYNLFDSATYTRVWGNGLGGTGLAAGSLTVGPGVGNGVREAIHPIYGRIPAQQAPAIGEYTDTIVVTLTF
jgi:spore coat protein U-like protein